ncbi:MAG: VCBS repeat-containing protein [Planctomycetota bacterium]
MTLAHLVDLRIAPLLATLLAAGGSTAAAQGFGPDRLITDTADLALDTHAVDLDGDGDLDVVSAFAIDNQIAWSQNLGGGIFGQHRVISFEADGASAVHAGDLDGDGDADVVSASAGDDKIAWYENLGGGTFGPQRVLTTTAFAALAVEAVDLDGDGDVDIVSASQNDDTVAWFENLGGGTFGPEQFLSFGHLSPEDVFAEDLNGDGDTDVLVGFSEHAGSEVAWIENLGGGTFGPLQSIDTGIDWLQRVHASDLDGDGDADALAASRNDHTIGWYENLGGGAFGPQRVISSGVFSARDVFTADVDGDGDLDVLAGSGDFDELVWFENLGAASFGPEQAIDGRVGSPRAIQAVDLDLDGDPDLLVAASLGGRVFWYENWGHGAVYCRPGVVNATGQWGKISATGSVIAANDDLTLRARDLPPSNLAFFLTSRNQGFIARPPNSVGNLCLSAPIGRYVGPGQVLSTSAAGTAELVLQLPMTPTATGFVAIQAGETWNFQCWHRDSAGGAPTSNFTDAVSVTFR